MKSFFVFCFILINGSETGAQSVSYEDSIRLFQKKYVAEHEVVKGNDKNYFRFFPANENYRVNAGFEKLTDTSGFIMKTSGKNQSRYFKYRRLHFKIKKVSLTLTVYQSERLMTDSTYKDYLFIPFTDFTSGEKSYGGGKYIDIVIGDIKNNSLELDFNKAYNPYCAYANGFNCPIPPHENNLPLAIKAGEMVFSKDH